MPQCFKASEYSGRSHHSEDPGEGTKELIREAVRQAERGFVIEPDDLYDDYTHQIHHRIDSIVYPYAKRAGLPVHWTSIKMLEGDELLKKNLEIPEEPFEQIEKIAREYESSSKLGDRETMVADSRYKYIEKIVAKAVVKSSLGKKTATEKIDAVVTHKIFAIPIFLLIMFLIFTLTFSTLGALLQDGVSTLIGRHLFTFRFELA